MRRKLRKLIGWLLRLDHRRLLELLGWPIRLPVCIVVVLDGPEDLSWLPHVQESLAQSKTFWAAQGIVLRPSIRAIISSAPSHENYYAMQTLHHWQGTGQPLTLYVWPDRATVGQGYRGQAFPNGTASIAGNVLLPSGGSMLDEIIDHELGHLLGLKHQDGTFMRAVLEMVDRTVTKEQQATVRETAYQFGGL